MPQDPTPAFSKKRLAALQSIPTAELPSPCFVIHLGSLEENARLLKRVSDQCGAKILLAQKGFACWSTYPLLAKYLSGTTASGLNEALLGYESFGGEIHVYAPAYKSQELAMLGRFVHTLVFNSYAQWQQALPFLNSLKRPMDYGLRVNPEHSTVDTDLYNPCSPHSRLGTTLEFLEKQLAEAGKTKLDGLDGLHFHALCEQDAYDLESTVIAFEARFEKYIKGLRWLNFGGGHHITRPGYDIEHLCQLVSYFREKYQLDVYLEPGEAVALHTGLLVTTVLDVVEAGGVKNAILDTSATCHMPDVLEMPYRPNVIGADAPGVHPHTYRLGGMSCLAGDIIGDYSFKKEIKPGQRLTFLDMSHYTMVKTTSFNGVPLPAIAHFDPEKSACEVVRRFGYSDYRERLS